MDVKIKSSCGRCNKSEEKTVTLEQAAALNTAAQNEKRQFDEFTVAVTQAIEDAGYGDDGPEVIVIHRNPAKGYNVLQLSNMCSSPDAKRNRGCKARVEYLLKEIFMTNPKKAPAPKKTAEAKQPPKKNGKK